MRWCDNDVVTVTSPDRMTDSAGQRLRELDGVRALAMTLVFMYHYGLPTGPLLSLGEPFAAPTTWGARIIPNLNSGVEIFFVLSGYLIYAPFARARAQGGELPGPWRYGLRRFFRIYPAYWVALVVLLVRHDIYVNGAANFLKHATLTHLYFNDSGKVGTRDAGLAISWTLVVEVSFYVFVPLWSYWVARRISLRTEVVALVVLTVLGFFLRWWLVYHHLAPALSWFPPSLSALAPGMLLAVADARRADWSDRLVRSVRHPWPFWLGSLVVFFVMTRTAYGYQLAPIVGEGANHAWHQVLSPWFAILLVIPIVLGPRAHRWAAIFRHPVAVWIGVVSYGAYLWHHSLIFHHVDIEAGNAASAFHNVLTMGGLYLFVVVLGAGSWYLLERPALRLADRIGRRRG